MPSPASRAPHADGSSQSLPAHGPFRGSSRKLPILGWLFGVAFAGFAIFAGLNFRPVPGRDALAIVALAAFALVGLASLWYAVLATLRWVRFRGLELEIAPCPAEPGRTLSGNLVLPIPYDSAIRFDVVLECTEHGQQGGTLGRHNSYERQLFREEAKAQGFPAPGGTRLAFSLPLPPEAPPSDGYGKPIEWTRATAKRIYVSWTLHVTAEVKGIDVAEEFEIPVRRLFEAESPRGLLLDTPSVSSNLLVDAEPTAPAVEPARDKSATRAYVYERIGNRIRVTQPAWRKSLDFGGPASWIVAIGPSVGFMAIGLFVLTLPAWPLGVVFLVIGASCVAVFVGYFAHSLTVEVDDAGIRIENRVFGFLVQETTLARGEIVTVYVATDHPAMKGGGMITREVRVFMRDNSEHLVAQLIPRERDAVILRNLIASRLAADVTGFAPVTPRTSNVRTGVAGPWITWKRVVGPWTTGMKAAVTVLFLAFVLAPAWPLLRELLGFGQTLAVVSPAVTKTAQAKLTMAERSPVEQGQQDAIRIKEERPRMAEQPREPNDPLAAHQLVVRADQHVEKREYREAEPVLRRALAILEGQPHAHVRARVGSQDPGFDRESVQRKLAWTLWELRRYQEALAHYQAAYATVAELDLEEGERNARLAYNSAGIMVNACSLKEWETADHAMAELKQRMQRLPEPDREWLQYWVRTGEPRLASRRC